MAPRCPACQSTALTQISMTMADGQLVDFTSCHACEHKSWQVAGEEIPLERVLALAAKKKK